MKRMNFSTNKRIRPVFAEFWLMDGGFQWNIPAESISPVYI